MLSIVHIVKESAEKEMITCGPITAITMQWCEINGMSVNFGKTECIIVSKRIVDIQLYFDYDKIISRMEKLLYLGYVIDEKLKHGGHLDNLVKKLNGIIFLIKYMAKYCTYNILISLYNALFMLHVRYCMGTWCMCNLTDLQRIFVLQKRAIRAIFKLDKENTCKEIFKNYKLITIPSLKISHLAVKYYFIKNTVSS